MSFGLWLTLVGGLIGIVALGYIVVDLLHMQYQRDPVAAVVGSALVLSAALMVVGIMLR